MSRAEILDVCTLAAHLATITAQRDYPTLRGAACVDEAADAMKLQRLGRSARNVGKKWRNGLYTNDQHETAMQRLDRKVDEILTPYGLDGRARDHGLRIVGLPGNTLGGDGEGFGI